MSSSPTQSQLCSATPISLFPHCQIFIPSFFKVITQVLRNELIIHMLFTTEGFFEVGIESWPAWDLNPQPLNSIQTLELTELSGHEFNSHLEHLELTLYYIWIYIYIYIYIYIDR